MQDTTGQKVTHRVAVVGAGLGGELPDMLRRKLEQLGRADVSVTGVASTQVARVPRDPGAGWIYTDAMDLKNEALRHELAYADLVVFHCDSVTRFKAWLLPVVNYVDRIHAKQREAGVGLKMGPFFSVVPGGGQKHPPPLDVNPELLRAVVVTDPTAHPPSHDSTFHAAASFAALRSWIVGVRAWGRDADSQASVLDFVIGRLPPAPAAPEPIRQSA